MSNATVLLYHSCSCKRAWMDVHCAKLLFLARMFVFGDLRQVMPSKNCYVNECALQVFQRAADNNRRKEGKL